MKSFSILGGKAMIVELPEGASNPRIEGQHLTYNISHDDEWGYDYNAERLPQGNWQIIGMLSEVTEMDAIPLVDKERFIVDGPYLGFRNYKGNKYDWFGTALESLESAILAEGYTFTNSLGNEKEYKKKYKGHPMFFANHMAKWHEAQSRVLSRERCLLLMRVDV